MPLPLITSLSLSLAYFPLVFYTVATSFKKANFVLHLPYVESFNNSLLFSRIKSQSLNMTQNVLFDLTPASRPKSTSLLFPSFLLSSSLETCRYTAVPCTPKCKCLLDCSVTPVSSKPRSVSFKEYLCSASSLSRLNLRWLSGVFLLLFLGSNNRHFSWGAWVAQ